MDHEGDDFDLNDTHMTDSTANRKSAADGSSIVGGQNFGNKQYAMYDDDQ